jgi:ABC-2 type transport system permease protein
MSKVIRNGISRGRLEILQFLRQGESVFFTFMFPVLLLVIFSSALKQKLPDNVSFSRYFAAGMIATGLVNSGFQNLAIIIPLERDFGTLKRLRGTPLSPISYFIGKVIMVLFSMTVQVILLLLAGGIFYHVPLPASFSLWIRFIWLLLLGTSTATLLGIAFARVPKSGRSASVMVTPIVIILQFFSGVFFIFTSLPKWMQDVADLFPLRWLTLAMRSIFLPDNFKYAEGAGGWQLGKSYLIVGAWFIAGLIIAIFTFKWSEED